jgi:hypothetical protein
MYPVCTGAMPNSRLQRTAAGGPLTGTAEDVLGSKPAAAR